MGQLGSTKIHRIPTTMLWDQSGFCHRYSNPLSTNSLTCFKFISKTFNYIFLGQSLIWLYPDHYYYSLYLKQRRLLRVSFSQINLTKNVNRGTNSVIPGVPKLFRLGMHIIVINNYLGFSLEKTRTFMRAGLDNNSNKPFYSKDKKKLKLFKILKLIKNKKFKLFNTHSETYKKKKIQIKPSLPSFKKSTLYYKL